MERIEFDLLFRWLVGWGIDEAVWDHSSFSTNRDRLLSGEIAAKFLRAILAQPGVKRLISSDHFSVNGTMITKGTGLRNVKRPIRQEICDPKASASPPGFFERRNGPGPNASAPSPGQPHALAVQGLSGESSSSRIRYSPIPRAIASPIKSNVLFSPPIALTSSIGALALVVSAACAIGAVASRLTPAIAVNNRFTSYSPCSPSPMRAPLGEVGAQFDTSAISVRKTCMDTTTWAGSGLLF